MANAISTKPSVEQQTIPGTETPATPPSLPGLSGIFFVPKSMDEMIPRKDGSEFAAVRVHQEGDDKRYCKFSVQFTYKKQGDKTYDRSNFYMQLVAFDDMADQAIAVIQGPGNLAEITAEYRGKKDGYDYFAIQSIRTHVVKAKA
tara:strand:- start:40 stop:474 length:435 start_codon:yes stop_codon:yes gene_type:complete